MTLSLQQQARNVARQGRYGDSMLMHVNPAEVRGLSSAMPLTVNPQTGQPEAWAFLAPLLGSMAGPALFGSSALWASALGSGLAQWAATGDLKKGLLAGVTGYGIGSALQGAGAAASGAGAEQAALGSLTEGATADLLANPEFANISAHTAGGGYGQIPYQAPTLNPAGQTELAKQLGSTLPGSIQAQAADIGRGAGMQYSALDSSPYENLQTALNTGPYADPSYQPGVLGKAENLMAGLSQPSAYIPMAMGMGPTAMMESREQYDRMLEEEEEKKKERKRKLFAMHPEPILYQSGGRTGYQDGGGAIAGGTMDSDYSDYYTGEYDWTGQGTIPPGETGALYPERQQYLLPQTYQPGFMGEFMYFDPATLNPSAADVEGTGTAGLPPQDGGATPEGPPTFDWRYPTAPPVFGPTESLGYRGFYGAGDVPPTGPIGIADESVPPPAGTGGPVPHMVNPYSQQNFWRPSPVQYQYPEPPSPVDPDQPSVDPDEPPIMPPVVPDSPWDVKPVDPIAALPPQHGVSPNPIGSGSGMTLQDIEVAATSPSPAQVAQKEFNDAQPPDIKEAFSGNPTFIAAADAGLYPLTSEGKNAFSMDTLGTMPGGPPTGGQEKEPRAYSIDTGVNRRLPREELMELAWEEKQKEGYSPGDIWTPPADLYGDNQEESWYNPVTMQTRTFPSGGWGPPPEAGWIQGTPPVDEEQLADQYLKGYMSGGRTGFQNLGSTGFPDLVSEVTQPQEQMLAAPPQAAPPQAAPPQVVSPQVVSPQVVSPQAASMQGPPMQGPPMQGPPMPMPSASPEAMLETILQDPLTQEVRLFILGESDNEEALSAFISKYGTEAFVMLRDMILQEVVPGSQTQGQIVGTGAGGMADDINGVIGDNKEKIAVSQDEFIVPADVVSGLGNGSSDAGSKLLYSMMDNVRQQRTGNAVQPPEIDAQKIIPGLGRA